MRKYILYILVAACVIQSGNMDAETVSRIEAARLADAFFNTD